MATDRPATAQPASTSPPCPPARPLPPLWAWCATLSQLRASGSEPEACGWMVVGARPSTLQRLLGVRPGHARCVLRMRVKAMAEGWSSRQGGAGVLGAGGAGRNEMGWGFRGRRCASCCARCAATSLSQHAQQLVVAVDVVPAGVHGRRSVWLGTKTYTHSAPAGMARQRVVTWCEPWVPEGAIGRQGTWLRVGACLPATKQHPPPPSSNVVLTPCPPA